MANLDRTVLFRQIERLYQGGTSTAQTDSQLLDRFLTCRDEGAFEAIISLHGPMVLSLCRRFLRDPRDIEDAFQATFLILARKAGSIRKREVLSSWLYGVAYRVATRARTDLLRRRSFETGVSVLDDLPGADAPEADEFGPLIDLELNRLPEKYRAPIVLCYLKEQTHDQAAAALRWPIGTVRSRLARGRELLRARLTRRGCAPASAFLGLGPATSWRACNASVPQPLVEATLAAAGRFLGDPSAAGPAAITFSSSLSGSASALAQGVLTTMAMTQIKVWSVGLVATGLLLGGAGAGAWAVGSARAGNQADKPGATQDAAPRPTQKAASALPAADLAPGPVPANEAPDTDRRLADLERKLDALMLLVEQKLGPFLEVRPSDAQKMPPQLPSPARNMAGEVVPRPILPPSAVDMQTQRSSDRPPPRAEPMPPMAQNVPLGPQQELSPLEPPRQREQSPLETNQLPQAKLSPQDRQSAPLPSQELPPTARDDLAPVAPPDAPSDPQKNSPAAAQSSLEVLAASKAGSDRPAAPRFQREPFDAVIRERASLKEMEAQIKIAIGQFERNKALFGQGMLGKDSFETSLGQIRLLLGRLEGWDDDLADEAERLKLEDLKKQAEIKVAMAQRNAMSAIVARNTRLNDRKKGMVSTEDIAKADSDDAAAQANVQVKEVEGKELELKLDQLHRRRRQVQLDIAWVRKLVPELAKEQEHGPGTQSGAEPGPNRPF
jgi:RNA polymerase sigma factor (sigma-70 family)